MKLLLLTLALAGGVVDGALHSYTVQNTDNTKTDLNAGATYHATNPAGTFCSGCDEVANMQPNAVLTCKTASTGIIITQTQTSTSGSVVNGGCKLGFFRTAGTGDGNDTCTACEANCQICSTATNCTKPMAGFYLTGADAVPAACTPTTDELCKDVVGFGSGASLRGYKLGMTAAEACLAGVSASGGAQVHRTADTTHAAGAAGSCKICPVGKVADHADDTGCADCPTIANKHADATVTCTTPSSAGAAAATNGILVADPNTLRKCADEFGYVPNANGTTEECEACPSNCNTCDGTGTDTSVGSCTGLKAGFKDLASPAACTATTNELCKDIATNKVGGAADVICPKDNIWKLSPGHAVDSAEVNFSTKDANSDESTTSGNTLDAGAGPCVVGMVINVTEAADGSDLTGAQLDTQRIVSACVANNSGGSGSDDAKKATFAPALAAATVGGGPSEAKSAYIVRSGLGCSACDAGKVAFAASTAGCQDCPTIDNSATGALLSCTVGSSAATASKIPAVVATTATGDHTGRRCKPGFFYTAGGGSAMATCTACETNCYTCSNATTCTHVNEGYYLAAAGSGNPTACTARTDAQCSAVANKTQFPVAVATVCTAGNNASADITDLTGCTEYAKTCPVVGTSPAGVAAPGIFAALLAAVAAALRM